MLHGLLGRTAVGRAVGVIMGLLVSAAAASTASAAEPVVPGFYRLRDEAKNVNPAELGQLLIGELNCTACHAPGDGGASARVAAKGAPDLSAVGARVSPQWIRAYLSDPHKVKPGATMPDLFHASEPQAKSGAVEFLTHFLAAQGGPLAASKAEGNTVLLDQGKKLYHSVGCVACHAPEQKITDETVPSVPHGELASKYTVESLAAFLLDPTKARPAGRMPSLHLSPKGATALATYLLREQLENPAVAQAAPPLRSAGLKYEVYDNTAFPDAKRETFDKIEPTSTGTVPNVTLDLPTRKSKDGFGVRFTGLIEVPRDGKYTFWTQSDDGSRLYIDDELVVNNDGVHAPQDAQGEIELRAGDHPFTLTFFEQHSGETLTVSWQGPNLAREPLPASALFKIEGRPMVPLGAAENFTPDPQKVAMGGRMFAAMGCANCHAMEGLKPMRPAKALAELKDVSGGCLAEKPAKGLPHYELSDEQRAFIGEALADANALAAPLEGEPLVTRSMAAMNCYACHRRGDLGGATKDRNPLFTMTKPFDMGDEGRLPPKLTGAGDKLLPAAMEQIIFEGKLHVRRHHMATRMPQFVKPPLGKLVAAMQSVDGGKQQRPAAEFTEQGARDGRLLVGIKGLGCTNCHGVAGVPSMGMPALDLSRTAERLKPGWFHELLLDPNGKNPGTRMPAFWFGGAVAYPDVAGGKPDTQIDAIWTYLSLGKSMGLPLGLQPNDGGYELMPAGEPLIHRTFLKGVSARAILVGTPEGLHVAFDAKSVRLAKAWRGKFFDAAGSRKDRGGAFHDLPDGADVINLPPGPSFAVLGSPNDAWPGIKIADRDAGGQFKGYRTDKSGQPTFTYVLGDVTINETPVAVLRKGGSVLVRKFTLKGNAPPGLTFLAAAGAKIEDGGDGVWTVDDKLKVRVGANLNASVHDVGGAKELRVPMNGQTALDIEMSW